MTVNIALNVTTKTGLGRMYYYILLLIGVDFSD
jgi:hypothetical protein